MKNDGTKPVDILRPFCVPCEKDLLEKVRELANSCSLRNEWSIRAKEVAEKRFAPAISIDRLPLIMKAMTAYYHNSCEGDAIKREVEELYAKDLIRYGL